MAAPRRPKHRETDTVELRPVASYDAANLSNKEIEAPKYALGPACQASGVMAIDGPVLLAALLAITIREAPKGIHTYVKDRERGVRRVGQPQKHKYGS